MSKTFFVGDHHFGHSNIIKFSPCRGDFKTIDEHNAYLVEQHNSVVSYDDKVFFLGDVCFGKQNLDILAEMQGNKYLIAGNHDTYVSKSYLQYFQKILGVVYYDKFILTHMPVHESVFCGRHSHNIHGHTHGRVISDKRYINVSIENLKEHKPIEISQIVEFG
jgi:calcineurin-like phosphoesterase family protein